MGALCSWDILHPWKGPAFFTISFPSCDGAPEKVYFSYLQFPLALFKLHSLPFAMGLSNQITLKPDQISKPTAYPTYLNPPKHGIWLQDYNVSQSR